ADGGQLIVGIPEESAVAAGIDWSGGRDGWLRGRWRNVAADSLSAAPGVVGDLGVGLLTAAPAPARRLCLSRRTASGSAEATRVNKLLGLPRLDVFQLLREALRITRGFERFFAKNGGGLVLAVTIGGSAAEPEDDDIGAIAAHNPDDIRQ